MRAVQAVMVMVTVWIMASIAGALAAVGPARLGRVEDLALPLLATVALVVVLAAIVGLVLAMVRRWWTRLLALLAAVPLVAIAAAPVGIATWAAMPPDFPLDASLPDDAVAVDLVTAEGDVLGGWYLNSGHGAAVVLAHGSGSTRADVLTHARALHGAGFGVLLVDARGHGESEGRANELGWWGESDLDAAVTALASMEGVDPARLGVVGISMGGEEALGAAGVDPRIRAVVAEGASQRIAEDKDGWLPGGATGALQRMMDRERDMLLDVMSPAPRPAPLRDAVAASDAPTLLITAGTVPDEAAAAASIAGGDPRVEIWTVDGASHASALAHDEAAWRSRVTGFLAAALAP